MDPQACWNDIVVAVDNFKEDDFDEREKIATNLENLAEWIRSGGFMPKC